MTHWGWYWKVKKKHVPKRLCSEESFHAIDSFEMFKNKEFIKLIRSSIDKVSFAIQKYKLVAKLQDDNSLSIQFNGVLM